MRFKAAAGVSDPLQQDSNPYTYASTTGNGVKDLMTPFYGAFAHNYGPVYQLLT